MTNDDPIEAYIAQWPPQTQAKLNELRTIISKAAPDAQQKISYGIPTFTFHGNLIHFGGANEHIGLYPGSGPIELFKNQLKDYQTSKGTIRLPLNKPLPTQLIQDIVANCIERNLTRGK